MCLLWCVDNAGGEWLWSGWGWPTVWLEWVFSICYRPPSLRLSVPALSALTDRVVKLEKLPSQILPPAGTSGRGHVDRACWYKANTHTHTNAPTSVLCPSSSLRINWISVEPGEQFTNLSKTLEMEGALAYLFICWSQSISLVNSILMSFITTSEIIWASVSLALFKVHCDFAAFL